MAMDIGRAAETLQHYITLALGDRMQDDMNAELADAVEAFKEAAGDFTSLARRLDAVEKKTFGQTFG